MKVDPKSDKELQEIEEQNLLASGIYDFEVFSAEDKFSAKGNEMSVVALIIQDANGNDKRIVDYLVSTDAMAYKIKNFAKSVGLLAEYERGELPPEAMKGCTGRCKIVVSPAKGEYRAKNTVADYLAPGATGNGAVKSADPRPEAPPFDDEIPF